MNRTLLSTAFALVLTAGFASAQQAAPADSTPLAAKHHRHNPQHEAAMLSRRLNLTPDQTARVEPILASREQKLSALHTDASLSPEAKHDQMRAIRLDTRQQLTNIITPEQMQKLQAMRRHRGGRNEAPPTPSGF